MKNAPDWLWGATQHAHVCIVRFRLQKHHPDTKIRVLPTQTDFLKIIYNPNKNFQVFWYKKNQTAFLNGRYYKIILFEIDMTEISETVVIFL